LTLGGALKRKEMLSARFGDILSELYLLFAALKRWEDEGRKQSDLPLLAWAMQSGFATIEERFDEIIDNFPNRVAALAMRLIVQPLGRRRRGPSDALSVQCAELLLAPSELRDRLTAGIFLGNEGDAIARLERAFTLVNDVEPIRQRMRQASLRDCKNALAQGVITAAESAMMAAAEDAVRRVIAVDDFAAGSFAQAHRPGPAG